MQRKPSARLSTRARVSRNLSLSSTMETLMGIVDLYRRRQSDKSALPRRRLHGKTSSDIFHAFSHVAQSISAGFLRRTARTASVVFDFDDHILMIQLQSHMNFR